jgi:basic amino acid/polyamine antiporter, APA family
MSKLFATKPLDQLLTEARTDGEQGLVRALGPYNLISLGIGAVIGAGIFVFTSFTRCRATGCCRPG